MKKYYKYFAICTAVLLFNCEATEETTLTDFVGFELGPLSHAIPKNTTSTKEVTFHASEVSATERTYSIEVAATSTLKAKYTVPATVTIPANSKSGTFAISVTDDDALGFVEQSLIIKFKGEAGRNFGNPVTVKFAEQCLETLVKLSITFDNWPEETDWEIFDLSGEEPVVIYSGGPYPGAANRKATLALQFCLSPGKYGIAVYDEYGDGGAAYTITTGNTVLVPKKTSASATSTATFTVQ